MKPGFRFSIVLAVFATCLGSAPALADAGASTIPFNMLLAPPAPGFVLLGVAPAQVERPGTPTDLAASIAENTQNLTVLPGNYALEFAPYWLFYGKGLTFSRYCDNRLTDNVLQTAAFSVATTANKQSTDTLARSLALGLRFSPLRGLVDPEFGGYADSVQMASAMLDSIARGLGAAVNDSFNHDWQIDSLKRLDGAESKLPASPGRDSVLASIEAAWAVQQGRIMTALQAKYGAEVKRVKSVVSKLQLRRFGWKLDVAGGAVFDFPHDVFDSVGIGSIGAWLNGGYDAKNWSGLGVVRLLSKTGDSDQTSLDLGARIICSRWRQFAPSFEVIYRALSGRSSLSERLVTDVPIAGNKVLSFTFGHDFGGAEGKLIFLVNLLMGFGADRPIL